jgi:putative acetyltransferase
LLSSLGFEQEATLRNSVRIAGRLVNEFVMARRSGDAAEPARHRRSPLPPRQPGKPVQVTIRGGSTDDWEANHRIWSQPSVYYDTMQIPYPSADWNRERVQERPPARFWPLAAEVEGRVVGTAGIIRGEHNRSHVGHLGMMVDTEYQGRGIGSALLEAAIDLVENWLGLARLQLEVYIDNQRAIGLYEKVGFEREGVFQSFGYRDGHYIDTLVMSRLRQGE